MYYDYRILNDNNYFVMLPKVHEKSSTSIAMETDDHQTGSRNYCDKVIETNYIYWLTPAPVINNINCDNKFMIWLVRYIKDTIILCKV